MNNIIIRIKVILEKSVKSIFNNSFIVIGKALLKNFKVLLDLHNWKWPHCRFTFNASFSFKNKNANYSNWRMFMFFANKCVLFNEIVALLSLLLIDLDIFSHVCSWSSSSMNNSWKNKFCVIVSFMLHWSIEIYQMLGILLTCYK